MIDEKAVARAIAREMHKGGDFGMDGNRAYEERPAEFLALARAAITALSPGSTGETDGWVLVPREPTLAMCNAGWREIDKQGFQTEDTEVAPIYRAMLAAAGGTE